MKLLIENDVVIDYNEEIIKEGNIYIVGDNHYCLPNSVVLETTKKIPSDFAPLKYKYITWFILNENYKTYIDINLEKEKIRKNFKSKIKANYLFEEMLTWNYKESEAIKVNWWWNSEYLEWLCIEWETVKELAIKIIEKANNYRKLYIKAEKTKRDEIQTLETSYETDIKIDSYMPTWTCYLAHSTTEFEIKQEMWIKVHSPNHEKYTWTVDIEWHTWEWVIPKDPTNHPYNWDNISTFVFEYRTPKKPVETNITVEIIPDSGAPITTHIFPMYIY